MRKFKENYKFRIMKVQKKMPTYKSPKNELFCFYILLIIQTNKKYTRVVMETNTHGPKIKDWLLF